MKIPTRPERDPARPDGARARPGASPGAGTHSRPAAAATGGSARSAPRLSRGRYANSVPTKMVPNGGLWSMAREFLAGGQIREPARPLPCDPVDLRRALPGDDRGLTVTWLGHSSVLAELDGVSILFDPVFADEISPAPWLYSVHRFQRRAPLRAAGLPRLDLVVISHDHYDHLEKETIRDLASRATAFFAPLGVGDHLVRWGVPPEKITQLTWWEAGTFHGRRGQPITLTCTPARHFSGRGVTDRNKTLWASWALAGTSHTLFHSGDSGYGPHFAEIGRHLGPFDLTLLENGQYNQRWAHIHMAPEETIQAHLDLGGVQMLPIHWGSFNLSLHDWWEPIVRARRAASRAGVSLLTPRVGQTLTLAPLPGAAAVNQTEAWWEPHLPEERLEERPEVVPASSP